MGEASKVNGENPVQLESSLPNSKGIWRALLASYRQASKLASCNDRSWLHLRKVHKNGSAYIFGAGSGGIRFLQSAKIREKVAGFLDNDASKHGATIRGHKVFNPAIAPLDNINKIYIASDYHRDIARQLANDPRFRGVPVINAYKRLIPLSWVYLMPLSGSITILVNWLKLRYPALTRDKATRRYPMRWLDQCKENILFELRPPQAIDVVLPRRIGQALTMFTRERPSIRLYQFDNAEICSFNRSIIAENLVVLERVVGAEDRFQSYRGGRLSNHDGQYALVYCYENGVEIDRAIAITAGSEVNYYHCLLELIPQLYYLKMIAEHRPDLRGCAVLVPEKLLDVESFSTAFHALAPAFHFVFMKQRTAYRVARLHIMTMPTYFLPHRLSGAVFSRSAFYYDAESLAYIRALKTQLSIPLGEFRGKRFFLTRGNDNLRKYNEDEIEALLSNKGFISINLADLTLAQQIAIFSTASMIVGASGAAWANLIFADEKVLMLMWMARESYPSPCYSAIAGHLGLHLDVITYKTRATSTEGVTYLPYHLEPSQLLSWVDSTTRQMSR